jgi:CelD/BcsL family acetyltransferase involved in cellulose biosynthesis
MSTVAAALRRPDRIDPVADPAWTEFLGRCAGAEIFHQPLWLELIQAQYGYDLSAQLIRGEDGEIEAGLPVARIESRLTGKRLVAIPFSDTCSPLVGRDAAPGAGAALGEALAASAAEEGLPLGVHAPLEGVDPSCVVRRFVRHELPLGADVAEVEKGFSKNRVVRNVKKARKEGLEFELGRDRAALDGFYRLHLLTRRKLGVPTQPKRFIRRFERLFEGGLGFVGTVRDEGVAVAAGVFLACDGTLTYKYGASDPAALGKRPNHLLHAEAIRWGCENGQSLYDMGRSDLDNEGLRTFKSTWGASELDLAYTYLGAPVPSESDEHGARERLIEKTIQRSPAFVGRVAGELLYRHYGQ